ncbi:MAG: zf-HC2 domain-containing protein [Bacillota bacterium]|nr:zf-HC2 domain-containing protein [Bacillota bacterium]
MNPCEPYEELISARLDGELTRQEQADLTAHLETCPRCRAFARDLRTLHTSLLTLAADPPAGMTDAIMAEVKPKPTKKKRPWFSLACAALLALVLLGSAPLFFGSDSTGEAAAAGSASPAEGSGISPETLPETESVQADTAPQPGGESFSLLTQEEARSALEAQLHRQGRDLTLKPEGLSEDGERWLFSAENSLGGNTLLFSVSRDSGVIGEQEKDTSPPSP